MPTTSLYPNLNELLTEDLKRLEKFINFPKANAIFQKINEQLKGENIEFDQIAAQLKVGSFFQEIETLVENEHKNLNNLVSLINAYCDSEPEKGNLNYLISLRKTRLTEHFDNLASFKPDDLDILNDLITNKSNKFLIRIKNIFNSFIPEYQYEAYKQNLLDKFSSFQEKPSHAEFKEIVYEMVIFKDSHETFQSLLRTNDFYKNQLTAIDEVQLNSEKIALIKDELDALEKNIVIALDEFNPSIKPVSDLQLELSYGFDKFNNKLIELKEANNLALIDGLDSLKKELTRLIKAPAYTFTSVILKSGDLLDDIANLHTEIQTASAGEANFNEYYKRYLALKSEASEITGFSLLKGPFDKFFTKKTAQQVNEISAYENKLSALVDSMANRKAEIFNSILKELQTIKDSEYDETKLGASTLAKNVNRLVVTLDENIPSLAKHRNTPFKSAFWCLFGVFRPATTSVQLIKEIKKELNQFNFSIKEKISSPTL